MWQNFDFQSILEQFSIPADAITVLPFGSGHINDSFLVRINEQNDSGELVQRINHQVFTNVPLLMHNIALVTGHIQKKLAENKAETPRQLCLQFLPATNGELFFQDRLGNFWRACKFIENSLSFDHVDSVEKAFQAGKAFGGFQKLIADLPANSLNETIPKFHNVPMRLEKFYAALERNSAGRLILAADEIQFIKNRTDEMQHLDRLIAAGQLPMRIAHNDSKINNVLFDDNGKALCVVDLDTVMPGTALYDFGDGIRTACNTGDEDDANLENVVINLDFFKAWAEGYLQEAIEFLTEIEIENMAFSAKQLTFIMGLRFLTDFIEGDVYYKTQHEYHNLKRARAQLKLLQSMEENFGKMQAIITELVRVEYQKKK